MICRSVFINTRNIWLCLPREQIFLFVLRVLLPLSFLLLRQKCKHNLLPYFYLSLHEYRGIHLRPSYGFFDCYHEWIVSLSLLQPTHCPHPYTEISYSEKYIFLNRSTYTRYKFYTTSVPSSTTIEYKCISVCLLLKTMLCFLWVTYTCTDSYIRYTKIFIKIYNNYNSIKSFGNPLCVLPSSSYYP